MIQYQRRLRNVNYVLHLKEVLMPLPAEVPKRCFTFTMADGKKFSFCIIRQTWPTFIFAAYPKHPTPDPAPVVQIEGVDPKLLHDLDVLDGINLLSGILSPERAKFVQEAVKQAVSELGRQLPAGVSLSIEK
jgi:hypothetical protein